MGVSCLVNTWQPVYRQYEFITGLILNVGLGSVCSKPEVFRGSEGKDQVVITMSLNTNYDARGGEVHRCDQMPVIVL